ncbi:MAG: hypothetical protein IKQ15_09530 [Kiritimatiellae bacterium]|nr:hypothetical protein [Kiritimatiellia bacterium]
MNPNPRFAPPIHYRNVIHPGDGIWCDRFIIKKGRVFAGPDREHWAQIASIAVAAGKRQTSDIVAEFHGGQCLVHLEPVEYHRFVRASHYEGTISVNDIERGEFYADREVSRALLHAIIGSEKLSVWRRWDEKEGRVRPDFVIALQSRGELANMYEDGHWPGWKEAWQSGLGFGLVKVGEWIGASTESFSSDIFAAIAIVLSFPQTAFGWIFQDPRQDGTTS